MTKNLTKMENNKESENITEWYDNAKFYLEELREAFEVLKEEGPRHVWFGIDNEFDKTENAINEVTHNLPSTEIEEKLKTAKKLLASLGSEITEKICHQGIDMSKRKKKKKHLQFTTNHKSVSFQSSKKENFSESTKKQNIPTINPLNASINYVTCKTGQAKIKSAGNSSGLLITMSRNAYNKIKTWCKLLDVEITALGLVKQRSESEFYIHDFFLFEQVVSKTQCEMKSDLAVIKMMEYVNNNEELRALGYNSGDLKCWWHSHNTMSTSPSGTDETTSKNYETNSYLITLISNHRDEFYTRLTVYKPIKMMFEDIPIYIEDPGISAEFIKERKEEIKKFVVEESYVYQYQHGYPGGYQSGNSQQKVGFHSHQHYKPSLVGLNSDDPTEKDDEDDNTVETLDDPPVNDFEQGTLLIDEPLTDDELADFRKTGDGPYGSVFCEFTIRYQWDYLHQKYVMYDTLTNAELTDEEVEELGAVNYNKALGLGEYNTDDSLENEITTEENKGESNGNS